MAKPTEHKTVQARIFSYAQEIGWTYVPREEAERRRRFLPHPNPIPEDGAREMMEHRLMTAQIRVHYLDLDEFLALVAREILLQPVREFGNSLSPKVSNGLLEFLSNHENQNPTEPRIRGVRNGA